MVKPATLHTSTATSRRGHAGTASSTRGRRPSSVDRPAQLRGSWTSGLGDARGASWLAPSRSAAGDRRRAPGARGSGQGPRRSAQAVTTKSGRGASMRDRSPSSAAASIIASTRSSSACGILARLRAMLPRCSSAVTCTASRGTTDRSSTSRWASTSSLSRDMAAARSCRESRAVAHQIDERVHLGVLGLEQGEQPGGARCARRQQRPVELVLLLVVTQQVVGDQPQLVLDDASSSGVIGPPASAAASRGSSLRSREWVRTKPISSARSVVSGTGGSFVGSGATLREPDLPDCCRMTAGSFPPSERPLA